MAVDSGLAPELQLSWLSQVLAEVRVSFSGVPVLPQQPSWNSMEHFCLCLTGPPIVTCTRPVVKEGGTTASGYSATSDIKIKLPSEKGKERAYVDSKLLLQSVAIGSRNLYTEFLPTLLLISGYRTTYCSVQGSWLSRALCREWG